MLALTRRLRGPDRDADLEARMRGLTMPVLAVFGTRDGMIPPEMGRLYKDLIPDAHLVFVYDAGARDRGGAAGGVRRGRRPISWNARMRS